MKELVCAIWEKDEYHYPDAYGFVPEIHGYLHEDNQKRPCIIVVPGGGYAGTSPTEGAIVAKDFYRRGYQAFVCVYTTNPLGRTPLKLQPAQDLSRTIRLVRSHADEYFVNPEKIVVCGFSAGAHLAGTLCVHFDDIAESSPLYAAYSNRPDAAILSYPVVTSGKKAHRGSFLNLLGAGASEEELRYMSLELQVTEETPPCFIWQTDTDDGVPADNAYLFAKACRESEVRYALHIFSEGNHGLSLSNDVWESNDYGDLYTLKQSRMILEQIERGALTVSAGERAQIEDLAMMGLDPKEHQAVEEVAVWPHLAETWLKKVLHL